ncbi:MAG: hypothetical protein K2J78_02565 [Muribaculaceae bacterium]|nr:hypothetical protein [Muribaculaceae bacterium]
MSPIYTETCFLSAGEANPEQELSLPILMAKLIDIATAHANSLGIGNPSMTDLKAGWVLSRVTVEMQSYPHVNDTYCISTWMVSFNRHFSERDFCISSPDGRIYGYARSIWMVMSTIDHSNVGLSHFTLSDELIKGIPAPIERQAKHGLIVSSENASDIPGGAILATHPVFDYRFQYCDLDSYRHVNTVRYVTLLLNRYSLDTFDTSFVKRLELSFMHEARYGMDTQLLQHDDESGKSSFLLREKDGQPLFYARLMFYPYPSK